MKQTPGAQPNKSLHDGVIVLQALAAAREPIGCRQLARELNLNVSRINRILKTLTFLGVVRQNQNKKYTSGAGMHVLATQSLFGSGLINQSLEHLEPLHDLGHIVAMGVLWRGQVSYLYHALPGMKANDALGRVGLTPATKSGIGMAILSQYTDDQIEELLTDGHLQPENQSNFNTCISDIRARGYTYYFANPELDHHTIAVPVGIPTFGAIGISGKIALKDSEKIAERLQQAASAISDI